MAKKNYVICFKNLTTKIIQIKIYLEDEPVQIKVHIKVLKKFKIIFDLSLIGLWEFIRYTHFLNRSEITYIENSEHGDDIQ